VSVPQTGASTGPVPAGRARLGYDRVCVLLPGAPAGTWESLEEGSDGNTANEHSHFPRLRPAGLARCPTVSGAWPVPYGLLFDPYLGRIKPDPTPRGTPPGPARLGGPLDWRPSKRNRVERIIKLVARVATVAAEVAKVIAELAGIRW
jgi:hypothetical protein